VMDQARRRFTRERVLPTPEELEIPQSLLPQRAPAPVPTPTAPAAAPPGAGTTPTPPVRRP